MRTRRLRHRLLLLGLLLGLLAAGPSWAAPAQDRMPDAALEARVQAVSAELRCLVCQNQSLADSHAELALDLKHQVREQLQAGRTPDEVVAYMTERYGDFVLYRPPFKATTALLWLGPALLLATLLWGAWRAVGVQQRSAAPEGLSAADHGRANGLLAGSEAAIPPPEQHTSPPSGT